MIKFGMYFSALFLVACGSKSESPAKATQSPGAGRANRVPSVTATVVQPMTLRQASLGLGTLLPAEQVDLKTQVAGRVSQVLFKEGQRVSAGALLLQLDDSELQASRAKAVAKRDFLRASHARKQKQYEGQAISQHDFENSASELAQAEADVRLLDAQITKTKVVAPFTGELGLRQVSPGAVLPANHTITTMVKRLPARVEFSAHADQASLVSVGAKVQVRLASGKVVDAPVVATEGSLNVTTRSLRVRASIKDPEGQVPGSAVEVYIPQDLRQGFFIPPDALSGNNQGPLVFVLREGKAQVAAVEVGPRTPESVFIRSGLQAGDTVLSIGAQNIRSGQAVQLLDVRP